MKRYALSLIVCLLSGSAVVAQTKPSVEGVWKITDWVEKGKTYSNLPGLFIFTKGHYSTVFVMFRTATCGAACQRSTEPDRC
jgi:hypothetical protein